MHLCGARDENRTRISTLARLCINHYTTHAYWQGLNDLHASLWFWRPMPNCLDQIPKYRCFGQVPISCLHYIYLCKRYWDSTVLFQLETNKCQSFFIISNIISPDSALIGRLAPQLCIEIRIAGPKWRIWTFDPSLPKRVHYQALLIPDMWWIHGESNSELKLAKLTLSRLTMDPGGTKGNRTLDLLNADQALSQLSYSPVLFSLSNMIF